MKLCALILLLTVTIASCGEIADQFPKRLKGDVQHYGFSPFHSPDYGIKQIGVEHTPCYGTCKVFTFIVNSDGTFHYHGENYVKRRGDWHGTVDSWELNQIFSYVAEIHYFDLRDGYGTRDTDGWGTYTMVVARTGKKVVYNYCDSGPATLSVLAEIIDRLMEHAKWKRG